MDKCHLCREAHKGVVGVQRKSKKDKLYWRYVCPNRQVNTLTYTRVAPITENVAKPKEPAKAENATAPAPVVSPAATETAPRVRAPRTAADEKRPETSTSGGRVSGDTTLYTLRLRGHGVVNVCDADLLPLVDGLLDELASRRGAVTAGRQLVIAADQRMADVKSCGKEPKIDAGREMVRVMVDRMLSRRMGPAEWLAIMPTELAIAQASGALDMVEVGRNADGTPLYGNDQTRTAVGDGVTELWGRITGAISGAALGGRFGVPGAALGGLVGSLFPEIVGGIEGLLGVSNPGGNLDITKPNGYGAPAPAPVPPGQPGSRWVSAPPAPAPSPSAGAGGVTSTTNADGSVNIIPPDNFQILERNQSQAANFVRSADDAARNVKLNLNFGGVGVGAEIPLANRRG